MTIRQTKKSLNHDSDTLYASWQHGMELLAHVWGSEESLEGMNAFLEKEPDFQQFVKEEKKMLRHILMDLIMMKTKDSTSEKGQFMAKRTGPSNWY